MKTIGIMQPYYFPYLGYFSLIKHTDRFILFDPVQFIRHGWIERNRILKQNEGWVYIKVPLKKHHQGTLIKDIKINNSTSWKSITLSQLEVYKKCAPYYEDIRRLFEQVFEREYDDIVGLDKVTIEQVCKYLGIKPKIEIFSEMDLSIDPPKEADEWALNICRAIGGVGEYWNPPGGKTFFSKLKYDKAGIKLRFQEINLEEYNQGRDKFEPGLSIIDVLMFNSPEIINKMLDNYELT